jgi:hypothetical protein
MIVSCQNAVNSGGKPVPGASTLCQSGQAGWSKIVDLALAHAFPSLPLAADQPVSLESVQGGIERALFAAECVGAAPLDGPRDRIAVQRPVPEDGQHERGRVPFQQLSF